MTILILFFAAMVLGVALIIVVLLLAGFRPQRSRRGARSRFRGNGGVGDGSGGTSF